MATLNFEDCKKVFFDTTVILDLMHPNSQSDRVKCVRALVGSLCKIKKARFYISAVTIGEIVEVSRSVKSSTIDQTIIDQILDTLSGKDIEVVAYSEPVALLQRQLFPHLSTKDEMNRFLEKQKALDSNWVSAREWLTKDFMIAATAKYVNADVIFTGDKKTFLPIATDISLPCVATYFENFNLNGGGDKVYGFKNSVYSQARSRKTEIKGGLFDLVDLSK
jgi:predicted nucleic acid-binding protein